MRITKIIKNVLSLFATNIYSKISAAIFFIVAARMLGVTNFGVYTLILTFISFFYIFSDWGLSTMTMRDAAKEPERIKEYLIHSVLLRSILALIAYIILICIIILLKYQREIVVFIIIAGLSIFPNNILSAFNSIFNAQEKMYIPAAMNIIFTTIYLLLGILCLYFHLGLISLMILMVTLSFINFLVTGWMLKDVLFPLTFNIRYSFLKNIFIQATPCAVLSILSIIYFRIDAVMLSKLSSIESVGLYNAAYRIIEFLMFISGGVMMAYFPEMSRKAKHSMLELRKSYIKSLSLLSLIILPIAVFFFFFANKLILLLFGSAFLPSAAALKILILALIFVFINAPFGNILYNSNKALKYLPFAIGLTLLNISLNFIFIPKMGFIGASYVTLITEIVGTFIQIYFIKQILFCRSNDE